MASFEVYIPTAPTIASSLPLESKQWEQAEFVRDHPAILALIFPFFWLIWHRLWFYASIYMLVSIFFFSIGQTDWVLWTVGLSIIPGIYVFLEGSTLLARQFVSKGYSLVDIIEAENLEAAEYFWFGREKPGNTEKNDALTRSKDFHPTGLPNPSHTVDDKPSFGLFAEI
jgi:hypothetical protein